MVALAERMGALSAAAVHESLLLGSGGNVRGYFPFGRRPFRFTVIMPAAPSERP